MVIFHLGYKLIVGYRRILSTRVICGSGLMETEHLLPQPPRQPERRDVAPIQFSSVAQSCPTLCDSMDCSMPGFPIHHQLPELAQIDVHQVGDAIQPSHPLLSPSPPTCSLSQHQGLFQWVSSLHQVAEILELQLQHQSFQWIFSVYILLDWLVWSPCSPRDSQESSPTPQFKSINSLANLPCS